jgi:hypothetical protein
MKLTYPVAEQKYMSLRASGNLGDKILLFIHDVPLDQRVADLTIVKRSKLIKGKRSRSFLRNHRKPRSRRVIGAKR